MFSCGHARCDAMYAGSDRRSIPPEVLLKSMLLIALYSARSERMLCKQLEAPLET